MESPQAELSFFFFSARFKFVRENKKVFPLLFRSFSPGQFCSFVSLRLWTSSGGEKERERVWVRRKKKAYRQPRPAWKLSMPFVFFVVPSHLKSLHFYTNAVAVRSVEAIIWRLLLSSLGTCDIRPRSLDRQPQKKNSHLSQIDLLSG